MIRRSPLRLGFLAVVSLSSSLLEAADPPSEEQLAFFEKRIRPVLAERCYECHSGRAKKLEGGLRLDLRDSILSGGDSGPAIVAGRPDESLLIQVARRHESLKEHPGSKLPDRVVADLVEWVRMGAPDPRDGTTARPEAPQPNAAREHWAFRPVERPALPGVLDGDWPLSDVDVFILGRLEREGLKPAKDADRFTWLRRVSFDLSGLPPTLEEIQDFLVDESPRAFETVVDRLLGSRGFGERWARYWLDLVGYADQKGSEAPIYARGAWRYRDYVIDSLNDDMPFDRFIRQQIAGDLMPYRSVEERASNLTGTGFLVLGDMPLVEADKAKLRVDVIDQQVDKVGKTFLGLTLGCARCHDHKFDPISQLDYYAMAGFFHGTSSVFRANYPGVWSEIHDIELPETEAQKAERANEERLQAEKIATLQAERARATSRKEELERLLKGEDGDAGTADAGARAPREQDDPAARVRRIRRNREREALSRERDEIAGRVGRLDHLIAHAELFVRRVPVIHGVRDLDEPTDMRITIRGSAHALGDRVSRGFPRVISTGSPDIPEGQSGRLQLADWVASPDNPLTARVAVNRIWQKIFGAGLVRNVDYFGRPEEAATHPGLLDHLAAEFVRQGWSRKKLVRSLVLSRTYRMSSAHDERSSSRDPDNRLLWRMNRGRLDAEALRDALIAVGNRLRASTGGPGVPYDIPENVVNIGPKKVVVNPPFFTVKKLRSGQEYERTIYLPIVRMSKQPDVAELRNVFDFTRPANTEGQRAVTTVPTQALFLMNSPALKTHAKDLSDRLQKDAAEDDQRLELLWLYVLNRPVTEDEKSDARTFLSESGDNAWPELCHALFACNEFLMRF